MVDGRVGVVVPFELRQVFLQPPLIMSDHLHS